jgi:hypothetical protein
MVFAFGRNGFFGYASASPAEAKSLMWWSTFETDSLPSKTNLDPEEIKASLRERHRTWADPVVQDIISKAEVETIYPTWVLPNLPHYGENGIVLVGDAAHAMSPTTGQGASQALEDAQTLSLLLAETLRRAYNGGDDETEADAVALALKLFYNIRQPRVAAIVERGKKMDKGKGDVGVMAEYAMYCFLWIILRFPSVGTFPLHFNRKQRHPLKFDVSEADAWGCQRHAIWLVGKGRSPEGVRRTTADLTSLSTNITFLIKSFQPG